MNKKDAILEGLSIACPEYINILKVYGIDANVFVEILSKHTYNLKELGISSVAISKMLKSLFPNRKTGSKPCTYLFHTLGMKYCGFCNQVYFNDSFALNKSSNSGYNTYCKTCQLITTSITQPNRQSKYKVAKLNRIVPWSDLSAIKIFYDNCPKDMHVDHIIPLQGINVSGLHVLCNLQYLTPEDNLRKSNTFNLE